MPPLSFGEVEGAAPSRQAAIAALGQHPDGTRVTASADVTDRTARDLGRVATHRGASVGAAGTVTAPAAGAAIATIPAGSLPAGTYEVEATVGYGGTPGGVNGFDLRAGATIISGLASLAVANHLAPRVGFRRVTVDGATAITVNAVAAGATGSVFIAQLSATRVP